MMTITNLQCDKMRTELYREKSKGGKNHANSIVFLSTCISNNVLHNIAWLYETHE